MLNDIELHPCGSYVVASAIVLVNSDRLVLSSKQPAYLFCRWRWRKLRWSCQYFAETAGSIMLVIVCRDAVSSLMYLILKSYKVFELLYLVRVLSLK